MKKTTRKNSSWTKQDLIELNGKSNGRLSGALKALGLEERIDHNKRAPKKSAAPKTDPEPKSATKDTKKSPTPQKTKKRQGVETKPVYTSLEVALPQAQWGDDWLAINIPGGRVLTYNELYSILQFRKYEAFRYKKICRAVIARALQSQGSNKPFFNSPTRLTLVRVGAKEMDRDALPIVFKYFIDTLKNEGIIDDDNPNIIADIVTHQSKGEPRLALRLDRLVDWDNPSTPTWEEWTDNKKQP